jgi:heat shock protein HslJ
MGIDLNPARPAGLRAAVVTLVILLTASCTLKEDEPLSDSRWLVIAVDGSSTVPGMTPLIVFGADDTVDGNGGCNDFVGTYQTNADRIRIGSFGSTLSSCGDSGAKALEEILFDVLRSDPFFEVSGKSLRLTSPGGTTVVLDADAVEESS